MCKNILTSVLKWFIFTRSFREGLVKDHLSEKGLIDFRNLIIREGALILGLIEDYLRKLEADTARSEDKNIKRHLEKRLEEVKAFLVLIRQELS